MSYGNQARGFVTDAEIQRMARLQRNDNLASEALGLHLLTYRRRKKKLGIPSTRQPASGMKKGRNARNRGYEKKAWGASVAYFNQCASADCLGHPLSTGFCVKCSSDARKAELQAEAVA